MEGILIISHGNYAQGLVDSARFIIGNNLRQLECVCYNRNDDQDSFHEKVLKAFKEVDSGDGVYILLDVAAGMCLKEAALLLNDKVEIISGVNVPLLLEVLTKRMTGNALDKQDLIAKGQAGLVDVREYLAWRLN
ncbi:MAG: PTS sugar transporter subunit IIA [Erysipelotrichaceae bacterium]|nr:PTS sugar transporter subunit IIA [Erysipelotrichaceae bacterium]